MTNTLRRAPLAALFAFALWGCGGESINEPPQPTGPPVRLTRISATPGACVERCAYRITIGTTHRDTGEPVAATLTLAGDGLYPTTVSSRLPEATAFLIWEFPAVAGTYELSVCPELRTECITYRATHHRE